VSFKPLTPSKTF